MIDEDVATDSETVQAQRAFLRERFLRMLTSISELPMETTLYNKQRLKASFGAADLDVSNIQVNDLKTPLGTQPAALLRTSDIISITVNLIDNDKEHIQET